MSNNRSEKNEMPNSAQSLEFVQNALRERIAPPRVGSVKARINKAARDLGWTVTRTRDAWYADPRVSINADEMCQVERKSGLQYARKEMRTNDDLIAKIDALMDSQDEAFYSAFRTALRSVLGVRDRS